MWMNYCNANNMLIFEVAFGGVKGGGGGGKVSLVGNGHSAHCVFIIYKWIIYIAYFGCQRYAFLLLHRKSCCCCSHRLAMCSGTLLPALSNIADRSVWYSSSISRHSASNFSLQHFSLFSAVSRACLSFWSWFSTSSLERKRLLVKGLATPLLSSFLFLHFWTKWCSFLQLEQHSPTLEIMEQFAENALRSEFLVELVKSE